VLRRLLAILVLFSATAPSLPRDGQDAVQGRYVQVKPLIGYAIRPIRKFITTAEFEVLAKVDKRVRAMDEMDERGDAIIAWHVEADVEYSPTYRLQQRILHSLRRMLVGVDGFTATYKMDIIVGRTQGFIMSTLDRLGCEPDLSAFDGQILMGAALCNRRVLVTNLTGYLFLRTPEQRITRQMEARREPPLFDTPYQIVARNSSSLAHEWMHFYRMAGLGGRVAPDEPLWFNEGFAEFWADMAKVRDFGGRDALLRYHVVRLRDFYDWARKCPGSLSRYRIDRGTTCEYHLGSLAVQYLVANYGGLEATARAFRMDGRIKTFAQGFEMLFGISLEDFEAEADRYIDTIRRAELTK
jgi:hypothetical protein